MVSLYLGDTYKLRGGGNGGVSASSATRGAILGRATPHPLVSPADFASLADFAAVSSTELIAVASVSLQRKPYQCIYTSTHATSVVNSSKLKVVTMTYECTEPSSAALPLMALYVTCSCTTDSSREPLETKHKKL